VFNVTLHSDVEAENNYRPTRMRWKAESNIGLMVSL